MEKINNEIKNRLLEYVLRSEHERLPFDKKIFEGRFCIIETGDITIEGKIMKVIGDDKVEYDHSFPMGPYYKLEGENFEIKTIERGRYEYKEGKYKGKKVKYYSFIEEPKNDIRISILEKMQ